MQRKWNTHFLLKISSRFVVKLMSRGCWRFRLLDNTISFSSVRQDREKHFSHEHYPLSSQQHPCRIHFESLLLLLREAHFSEMRLILESQHSRTKVCFFYGISTRSICRYSPLWLKQWKLMRFLFPFRKNTLSFLPSSFWWQQ